MKHSETHLSFKKICKFTWFATLGVKGLNSSLALFYIVFTVFINIPQLGDCRAQKI